MTVSSTVGSTVMGVESAVTLSSGGTVTGSTFGFYSDLIIGADPGSKALGCASYLHLNTTATEEPVLAFALCRNPAY